MRVQSARRSRYCVTSLVFFECEQGHGPLSLNRCTCPLILGLRRDVFPLGTSRWGRHPLGVRGARGRDSRLRTLEALLGSPRANAQPVPNVGSNALSWPWWYHCGTLKPLHVALCCCLPRAVPFSGRPGRPLRRPAPFFASAADRFAAILSRPHNAAASRSNVAAFGR